MELIDRENYCKNICRCGGLENGCDKEKCQIWNAPTVDAIPVVRCKECKYYMEFRTNRNKQLMRWCYRMGKHDMEYRVKPDDFCSYGERRKENE